MAGTGRVKQYWGEIVPPPALLGGGAADNATQQAPPEEPEGLLAPPPPPPPGGDVPPPPGGLHVGDSGTDTPSLDGSLSVSSSLLTGLDTPASIDLRKGGSSGLSTPAAASSAGGAAPQLYRVLEERSTGLKGSLLATTHAYVVPSAASSSGGGVAVALNPEDLSGMDEAALAKKYEAELASSKVRARDECASLSTQLLSTVALLRCCSPHSGRQR
jgi:hypothetical protein